MALQPVLPYPDFHVCDGVYGNIINTAACLSLVGTLPGREELVAYTANARLSRYGPFDLPFKMVRG